jgi:type IV pilus assembly protein PilF
MTGPLLRAAALCCALVLAAACSSPPKSREPSQPEPSPPPKPAEVSPAERSRIHTELAAGYYERGKMDVALEELDEAVKLDPNRAQAYNLYGLIYAMLGENAKAEQNFRRALALAPQDSDIRHNWGWYLCTTGHPREAIPEFEAALRNPLYRTPEVALINAGRCSMEFGDIVNAEIYFKRALALSPNNPTAAYGLALLAYRGTKYDEARNWLRAAVQQPAPTAAALYLGMCIERKIGDRQIELSYVSQLRNRYPESAETKAIATGNCE